MIKAIIARGYANKAIQFYFNTPQRSVNSGRISEIKAGDRWAEVEPVSQFELDEFIDHHPLRDQLSPEEEPEPPLQISAASVFTVTDEDQIDVVVDPLVAAEGVDNVLDELHLELQEKSASVLALGHNLLGEAAIPVERFHYVVQKDRADISTVLLWSRGNRLRATLNAHDAVAGRTKYIRLSLIAAASNNFATS